MSQATIAQGSPNEHGALLSRTRSATATTSIIETGALTEGVMIDGKRCVGSATAWRGAGK